MTIPFRTSSGLLAVFATAIVTLPLAATSSVFHPAIVAVQGA